MECIECSRSEVLRKCPDPGIGMSMTIHMTTIHTYERTTQHVGNPRRRSSFSALLTVSAASRRSFLSVEPARARSLFDLGTV